MNQDQLREIIEKGESETVEFKENFDKEAIETVGAFANTKGGTIFIGFSDKGKMIGVQLRKDTVNSWINQIAQCTDPRMIPEIEIHTLDGMSVVVILIKEFPIKPISVKGKCYRRAGTSNRVMTPSEIVQIHLHSTDMSWDKFPARDASLDDLDPQKIKNYARRANESGRRKIGVDEAVPQILEKLGLIKDGRPVWAAILLFGKELQPFLSQAKIHCGRFRLQDIVIDDRMTNGTIIEQIEEAMDFIRKNISVRFVITGKPQRDQIWEYPLDALREAIINAVCHRDYALPSNIDVRIYDNELIIWSPGGLPPGITLNDLYKSHSSALRNKGIAEVFYDIELIEQWGSGIGKMRNACIQAGLPEPQFEEQQGFRVIFTKDRYTEEYLKGLGCNDRQIKAVVYAKEKGSINLSSFKILIPTVSEKTLYRDLQELVQKKVLKEVGEKKGRRYQLI